MVHARHRLMKHVSLILIVILLLGMMQVAAFASGGVAPPSSVQAIVPSAGNAPATGTVSPAERQVAPASAAQPAIEKLEFAEYDAALAQLRAHGNSGSGQIDPSALPTYTQEFWESEPNNAIANADLPTENPYLGNPQYLIGGLIDAESDIDVYKWILRRGTISVFGQWLSDYRYRQGFEGDLYIGLYDGSFNMVAEAVLIYNQSNPIEKARYLEKLVTGGNYYIVVKKNPATAGSYAGEPYGMLVNFVPQYDVRFLAEPQYSVYVDEFDKIPPQVPPTKTGYTFTGWYQSVMPGATPWNFATDIVTSDMFLYPSWSINHYTVTFKDWDNTVLKTESVAYQGGATAPKPGGRPNHTFAGWDKDFSKVVGDMTVTALYALNRYTVTFRDWNGTVLKTETVEHGQAASAPAAPAREHYTFTGWDKAFGSVTGTLTVTAQYALVTYPVTFKDWDGTTIATQDVGYGTSAVAPAAPSRTGYVFAGWDTVFDNVTGPLTITAQYVTVPVGSHVVRFNDWNGYTLKAETVVDGGAASAPASPTRTGYTFTGWDRAFNNVTADLTVTAQYALNSYTVTFNTNGSSAIAPVTAKHGALIPEPALPTRLGYWFQGWYKDAAFTDDWIFDLDVVTADQTIHLKWTQMTQREMLEAFVTRFYSLFFGRSPDAGGLNFWVDKLARREYTGARTAAYFVDSGEFRAMNVNDATFLDMMYRAFFDREPDAAGKGYWQSRMDQGLSRDWVFCQFVNSQEFASVCTAFGIEKGSSSVTHIADFHPQITAFVTRFYTLCLERKPDQDGLNYWVYCLYHGSRSGAMLANDFVFSQEFVNRNTTNEQFVTIMYRAFFGREPEAGGYGYWVGELASGRRTRKAVLAGFVYSNEFQGICNDYGIVRGTLP